jgi:hypothetical protein
MREVIRTYGTHPALVREGPPGVAALIVAELFYKFHSFALECLAFLATWYVFSAVYGLFVHPRRASSVPRS